MTTGEVGKGSGNTLLWTAVKKNFFFFSQVTSVMRCLAISEVQTKPDDESETRSYKRQKFNNASDPLLVRFSSAGGVKAISQLWIK